jgi:hypothetical protein
VAVLSLSLGIGANTPIFSLVNSLLLHPLPVKDPVQLVLVSDNTALVIHKNRRSVRVDRREALTINRTIDRLRTKRSLVRCRLLRVINNQNLNQGVCRFKFQPQLLLNGRDQRRRRVGCGSIRILRVRRRQQIWRPRKVRIEAAVKSRAIENDTVRRRR